MGLTKTFVLVGAGAALAYFLDPEKGSHRREKLTRMWDQTTSGDTSLAHSSGETTIVTPPSAVRRPVRS